MFEQLQPQDTLDDADLNRGLRMMLLDGVFATVMTVFTSGAFLVGFALLLGASNWVIGLLAAIPPLSQLLQLPAIFLVERTRLRKMVVVVAALISRAAWLGILVVPWVLPERFRLAAFFICLSAFYGVGAFAGCAFNSWIRDLIPSKIMGSYLARRMTWAVGTAAVASMVAGAAIDLFKERLGSELLGYTVIFAVGTIAGFVSLIYIGRMPEPRMRPSDGGSIRQILAEPFRDLNFRQLLVFLGSWNFAVNFAAPFFAVYMLKRLGLSMTWVLALAVLSQLMNVLFLRLWGRLADRFSNKSVLRVAGPIFILSFLLWPFTTMSERYLLTLTLPILAVIHALGGISTAGIMLSATNVALKLAPHGKATAYLAMNALVSGAAATVAPIAAGFVADWLAGQELAFTLRWTTDGIVADRFELPVIVLRDFDFLFVMAFLMGLHAMHRLLSVKEEGEVTEDIVAQEFYAEVWRGMRSVSHVFGLRVLNYFPYSRLRDKEVLTAAAYQPKSETVVPR